MSWQEKIQKRQQEKTQFQSEAERKLQAQHEQLRLESIEEIKPLLQALEDLKCREMLNGIKNEVWQLGEVTVTPDLNEVTHESPVEACVSLMAIWPYWGMVPGSGTADSEGYSAVQDKVNSLIIVASYEGIFKSSQIWSRERKIAVGIRQWDPYYCKFFIKDWTVVDENTPKWLEDRLSDDCLERKDILPYSTAARKDQAEIDEHLNRTRKR